MVKTKKSLTGADFLEWEGMKNTPGILPGAFRYFGDSAVSGPWGSGWGYFDSSASFTAARVMPMRMKKAKRTLG